MSLAGATLASTIMWWHAAVHGADYTTESWVLIAPLWAAPVMAALVAARWAVLGAALLAATSIIASTYYADVFGYAPGAVVFGVAIETCLRTFALRRAEARV
jgi:hypothetical protein